MNGRMDVEMMEAEYPAPPLPSIFDQNGATRNLLSMARQLIDQGRPAQALQAVVMAMRMQGGEEAVFQALNRARELYRNKVQQSAAADELAALFAECAIIEATLSDTESSQYHMVDRPVELDVRGTSILAETGRNQVVLDAFVDGSSFVCLPCGGLVSNQWKDEHYTFWCCKL